MYPMRPLLLAATLAASAAHAHAERTAARRLDLTNAGYDSVASLAVAPAGSDAFRGIALGEPVQGGHTTVTVDLPDGGCLRDFRVVFGDGRSLLYPAIDVCRYRRLQLRPGDDRR